MGIYLPIIIYMKEYIIFSLKKLLMKEEIN